MDAGRRQRYEIFHYFAAARFSMEMHQVRYFLAVARTLNFTRAAEECHVAQPSLTRAIHQLEGELGGDLFRRERPAAQLTELGQRMLPLLKQCYDSAQSARTVAASIKTGEVGALRLALSHTIDLQMVMPHIQELTKHFRGLELKLFRGTASDVIEYLKRGDAELGLSATTSDEWDRLDAWPLFEEDFCLVGKFWPQSREPRQARSRRDPQGAVAYTQLLRKKRRTDRIAAQPQLRFE